jgi:hypothetical protein
MYDVVATRNTPALVIYLIDISGSMAEPLDGLRKIDHVEAAIERIVNKMVQRSTRGELISPRYRVAMIAYTDDPIDILGGVLTIDQVVQRGKLKLKPNHLTNTDKAFAMARDILHQELPKLGDCPAPMVCHLTDGEYTGADPSPIARDIMQMSNADGNVLIENIYVGADLTEEPIGDPFAWPGLLSEQELKSPQAKKLFPISSELPASYADVISDDGYALRPGSRMLIPGTNRDLIQLAFAMSGATPTR